MAHTIEYKREYYRQNREKIIARQKAKYKTLDGRVKQLLTNSRSQAKRDGHVPIIASEDEVRAVITSQLTCQCCGKAGTEHRKLCLDHDHKTGRIRGMLCDGCNAIAQDIEKVKKVLQYLQNHEAS